MNSMSALSSSSATTSHALSMTEQNQKAAWLQKAQDECEIYDAPYEEACAVVETAIRILGKIKTEENQAKYQIIRQLKNSTSSRSEIYQSFCDPTEVQAIESGYAMFREGQKKNLDKIIYFKNLSQEDVSILEALLPLSNVTILDLGWNNLEEIGMRSLAAMLVNTHIINLNLKNNSIEGIGALSLAQVLSQTRITSLDLSFNNIGEVGAQSLAQVLPQTRITCLNLCRNGIGRAGVQSLAQVLPQTQITSLNLWANFIGEPGVQSLARVLPSTRIVSLYLGVNRIGVTGAQSLSEVLSQTQITSLNLWWNGIGNKGTQSLAQVLPSTQIVRLNLGFNDIGETGTKSISHVLASTRITRLNLKCNEFVHFGINDLIKAIAEIKFNQPGKTIDVVGVNEITDDKIAEAMEKLKLTEQSEKEDHKAADSSLLKPLEKNKTEFQSALTATLGAVSSSSQVLVSSASSSSCHSSSATTFPTLSMGVSVSSISIAEYRDLQERVRQMRERVEKAEAELKALREGSEKVKREGGATKAVTSSDVSIGGNVV